MNNFCDLFRLTLPKEIDWEQLKSLAPAQLWQDNPQEAAIRALTRSQLFDTLDYLARYPDVQTSGIEPIRHFILYGLTEKRTFTCKPTKEITSNQKNSSNKLKIKIFLAMHKESYYPAHIKTLCPIQVGTALSKEIFPNMLHDNLGKNISSENRIYCELTALYYVWKNVHNLDYYGFWHYRRYFNFNFNIKYDQEYEIINDKMINDIQLADENIYKTVSNYDIILATEWYCTAKNSQKNITIYEHWCINFPEYYLTSIKNNIALLFPQYLESVDEVFNAKSGSFCNMFIMKKSMLDDYCCFCFSILEAIKKDCYIIDRILGHIAERLLMIYVKQQEKLHQNIRILKLPRVLIKNTTPKSVIELPNVKQPIVSVVLACNNNFVPIASVLLVSILHNSSKCYFYDIIIMHRDITPENQEILTSIFQNSKNFMLRFANVSRNFAQFESISVDRHFTVETYFRFFIIDIFKNYQKIIYLDCDMVVNQDLADLYKIDLGDHAIAAVRDLDFIGSCIDPETQDFYQEKILKNIQINNFYNYFQAGCIVFNIKKIISQYTSEDLFHIALSKNWFYYDQDVLNYVFNGQVLYINQKWNVLSLLEKNSNRAKKIMLYLSSDYKQLYLNARKYLAVIHYAGIPKVWKSLNIDLFQYFWRYAKYSVFYELLYKSLLSDLYLPYGKIVFINDSKNTKNIGINILDININKILWTSGYLIIDFIYLADHFEKTRCKSSLFINYSYMPINDKEQINIQKFCFDLTENVQLLNNSIGYKIIDNKIIRIYAKYIHIYQGFSWRIRELQSRDTEIPSIKMINECFIKKCIDLVDVIFKKF